MAPIPPLQPRCHSRSLQVSCPAWFHDLPGSDPVKGQSEWNCRLLYNMIQCIQHIFVYIYYAIVYIYKIIYIYNHIYIYIYKIIYIYIYEPLCRALSTHQIPKMKIPTCGHVWLQSLVETSGGSFQSVGASTVTLLAVFLLNNPPRDSKWNGG